jgi:hypothetical protein
MARLKLMVADDSITALYYNLQYFGVGGVKIMDLRTSSEEPYKSMTIRA